MLYKVFFDLDDIRIISVCDDYYFVFIAKPFGFYWPSASFLVLPMVQIPVRLRMKFFDFWAHLPLIGDVFLHLE